MSVRRLLRVFGLLAMASFSACEGCYARPGGDETDLGDPGDLAVGEWDLRFPMNDLPPPDVLGPDMTDLAPPLQTTCGPCNFDFDCLGVSRCVNNICVPRCDPASPSCPRGFTCVGGDGGTIAYCRQPAAGCCIDQDGDGYGHGPACLGPDCDDGRMMANPAATEVCNGADDNCNGMTDESLGSTTCGVGPCMRTVQNCVMGVPQTCVPGTPVAETCNNIDDNCNGMTDDGTITCGVGACRRMVPLCVGGVMQTCTPGTPAPSETCNNIDDNCNGMTDEGFGSTSCGVGGCRRTVNNCTNGMMVTCMPGQPQTEICNSVDDDCDGRTDLDAFFTDGIPNLCSGASGRTVSVGRGGTQDVTGVVDPNGNDYFLANFTGVPGAGFVYHPVIQLVDSASGQYVMSVRDDCGSGPQCGGDIVTFEMNYPDNPNGCRGAGNCTDATPKRGTWVVEIRRTSLPTTCAQYRVRVSNQ